MENVRERARRVVSHHEPRVHAELPEREELLLRVVHDASPERPRVRHDDGDLHPAQYRLDPVRHRARDSGHARAAGRHRDVRLHRRRGLHGAVATRGRRRVRRAARAPRRPRRRGRRRRRRNRRGHAGRRVLRRLSGRDRGGARRRAPAARTRGDGASRADRHPHRAPGGDLDRLRRPRRSACSTDLRGRPRRAGAALAGDARARGARAAGGRRRARSRRASAEGPDGAAAALAARHRRAGFRVPCAADAREPADEPPRPADAADRARTGARAGRGAASPRRRPPPHAHRPGRFGEDAPRAAGRGRAGRGLSAGRLPRRARADPRPGAAAAHGRADGRGSRDGGADLRARREGAAPRARQRRAPTGRDAGAERRARRSGGPQASGHEPHAAPALRRTGASGAAALGARPGSPPRVREAHAVRGRRALRRARSGREGRLRRHLGERAGDRGDLRPPRRSAAGDRAGGRAGEAALAAGAALPAGAPFRAAHERPARPADAAAGSSRDDRLELRPARTGGS